MLEIFQQFFARKGINKSGICEEAGISQQNLNSVLNGHHHFSKRILKKLMPVLERYGLDR